MHPTPCIPAPEDFDYSDAFSTYSSEPFVPTADRRQAIWARMLGRPVAPTCEHGEPCILLATKKPGVNFGEYRLSRSSKSNIQRSHLTNIPGRTFYICNRPLNPSGQKQHDTQWRCHTFVWSSNYRPKLQPSPISN